MLLALLGFIFPTRGRIQVDGIEVTKKSLPTVREKVGLIFQDPDTSPAGRSA
jgi:cobalt/nickel transport system ATP-binding protein